MFIRGRQPISSTSQINFFPNRFTCVCALLNQIAAKELPGQPGQGAQAEGVSHLRRAKRYLARTKKIELGPSSSIS